MTSGVAVGLYLIIFQPIPDEDAYISFVFSKSLNLGMGLTYLGAKVEGFTNPLTVLIASLVSLVTDSDPAASGFAFSIIFTLILAGCMVRLALRSDERLLDAL